jgi:hypothetical protein
MSATFKDCGKPLTFNPATIHGLIKNIEKKILDKDLNLMYEYCFALY